MATQATNEDPATSAQNEAIFQQLESHDWAGDAEFQSGLQAILGSHPSAEETEQVTGRARCFYYARKKNVAIDFDAYEAWRAQHSAAQLIDGTSNAPPERAIDFSRGEHTQLAPDTDYENMSSEFEPPAPYPTSFSQIVELISSGQPIPGVKEVPDVVLEGQASESSTSKRKKPWEKNAAANIEVRDWGTFGPDAS